MFPLTMVRIAAKRHARKMGAIMRFLSLFLLMFTMSTGTIWAAFEGKIFCTKAQNIQDQWIGILPGRPPTIPLCAQVVRQEPLGVNIMFLNPTIKDGKINVTGKLKVQTPAGKTLMEAPLQPQTPPCRDNRAVFMFPDSAVMCFEPQDAVGTYVFSAELKDENSGVTSTARASVKLEEKISTPPDKTPFAAIENYYKNPAPQNILPAFKEFLGAVPAMKQKQGDDFNPLSCLAMFVYLLQANPQVQGDFARLVNSLKNPEEQSFGAVILHELGDWPFALLSPEAQTYWKPQLAGVFQVAKVTTPWQLDVLWSEFFVTGKRAPLEKIVAEIKLMEGNLSPENYKKLTTPTQQDQESLMRYMNGYAAAWSVASNTKQHPLVAFYLEAMLNRKEIQDQLTREMIAKAIENINNQQAPAPAK